MHHRCSTRDILAGSIVLLAGLGAVPEAAHYEVGSFTAMRPGFFPLMLSGELILLGVVIALSRGGTEEEDAFARPDWRGWACIIAGLLAFVALGERAGLAPTSFFTIFVSALGDRKATLSSAAALACLVTVFAVVVFGFVLQLQLPIVRGLQHDRDSARRSLERVQGCTAAL